MPGTEETTEVFAGLNVLDMTNCQAGALATMVLADNGAAVVSVVPRHLVETDCTAGAPGARQWHRGKERRILDLRSGANQKAGHELADTADILVESYGHSVLAEVGFGWEQVSKRNPRLIYCSIDAFGNHPRLAGVPCNEGVVDAAAGRMVDFGTMFGYDRPCYSSSPVASMGASQAVLQGICAALHQQLTTGVGGRYLRTSLVRSLTPFDLGSWAGLQFPSLVSGRIGVDHPFLAYIAARAKDGIWLQFANYAPHLFWQQADLLGLGHLRADPRFAKLPVESTADDAHRFWEEVLLATATKTSQEWMEIFTDAGRVGVDIVRHTNDGMDHPQARFNGDVVLMSDSVLGGIEGLGPIARMSATPSVIGAAARPWHTKFQRPPATGKLPGAGLPLSGVTVVEAAAYVAAPLAPVLLADLGARVIKIEPLEGDPLRGPLSLKLAQGKESIAVDLKSPHGIQLVHRIMARADLFIHNYRPGVPERLGLDYKTLSEVNPALVYLYAGAYGEEGPFSHMPAFHPIAGAIAGNAALQVGYGTLELQGDPDLSVLKTGSLRLGRANEGHPDMVSACVYATSLLLGLVARDRFGVGQKITATMLGANAYLMSDGWIRYSGQPERPTVDSDLLGTTALNRLYVAADGWMFLGCGDEQQWRVLCTLMRRPALEADGRFSTPEARLEHDGELRDVVASWIARQKADELEAAAVQAGLGCVRADRGTFAEFQWSDDDESRHEVTQRVDDPRLGPHWRHQSIVDMGPRDQPPGPAPLLGQHTIAIMEEFGYAETEIKRLLDTGVVKASEGGDG